MKVRGVAVVHHGLHTEYAGTGRVRFVSFLGGAGYCVWISRTRGWNLRGFTVYVRTVATSGRSVWGEGFGRWKVTTDPNRWNLFSGGR